MKEYFFGKEEFEFLENLRVPLAVFQFIDKRIVLKALSAGFCDLFDFECREDAYYVMTNDIFSTAHPDDAARLANAAYKFATEECGFEIVYRVRTRKESEYKIVHALGEHIYKDTGERLAYVWYTNEGSYTSDKDLHNEDLRDAFRSALHHETLIQTSYYDNLTGLPNMSYFLDLVVTGRKKLRSEDRTPAILFIDMKGMKFFNRKYGFAEGDNLLRSTANIIARSFNSNNCGRFGQDHFAVLTDNEGLEERLQKLMADLSAVNGGKSLPVKIGVYVDEEEGVEPSAACERARYACDTISALINSDYAYFSSDMLADIDKERYIIDNLDRAMAERWIQVHYQPIIRAANGKICEEEALSRWVDPVRGWLSPADFIPALEESRLIYKLDLYVIDRVIEKIKVLQETGVTIVPQSVNLSRVDFDVCDIVEEIRRRVDDAGIGRDKITIEITESVIGRDLDFIKKHVEHFQSLGFRVWMDDFGSGYSSLDVLQNIHFDVIKFDMRFMQCFGTCDESRIILSEMARMVIGMGMDTVCEGVETEEQVMFLREIGCTMLQGFYYGKPIPLEEILDHRTSGIRIGFENPEETGYYTALGRINLYDTAVFALEDKETLRNFFDTIPMAVMESTDDCYQIVRCNPTYKDFMQRVFGVTQIGDKVSYEFVESITSQGLGFLRAVRQCGIDGKRAIIDEDMPDGSTVHAIVKRVAVNEVTGTAALAVAVLAVIDKASKNAVIGYAQIASSLTSDYFDMYYVDLETDEFTQFSSATKYNLNTERHDFDFFETSRRDALTWVFEKDRDYFIGQFTKENIVHTIDTQGAFTLTYRLMAGDSPEYVNMKAVRMKNDDRHIIIGVNNVDAQMKEKQALEQLEEERTTFMRISALAGNYIVIYSVDPETDNYYEYSSTPDIENLGVDKEGDDFFGKARENGKIHLFHDDLDLYLSMFTKENVMREIEQNGVFELQYRLILDGEPRYVSLKAAMVLEKSGPQLIVGINDVDARVRREMEYMSNLAAAQSHAKIDALTGVKNLYAFEEAEGKLDAEIGLDHKIEFAVVILDVRGLSRINETKGYAEGNEAIKEACMEICTIFKHSPVYRIEDDRFAVIATGRDYDGMDELLERLEQINAENELRDGIVIAHGESRYKGRGTAEEVFADAYDSLRKHKSAG